MSIRRILQTFFLVSLFQSNVQPQKFHALTFFADKTHNLGESIATYSTAKWLAYKYNLHFYAAAFDYSQLLSIDQVDPILDQQTKDSFAAIVTIESEDDLIKNTKKNTQPTLFVVTHATKIHFPQKLIDHLVWPDVFSNLYCCSVEHKTLGFDLKRALKTKKPFDLLPFPHDKITVATCITQPIARSNEATLFPLKVPPEQFYVDQITKLSDLFYNKQLLIYVVTNDTNPKEIVDQMEQHVNRPNVAFCYDNIAQTSNGTHDCMLKKIYNIAQCDCLIRSQSDIALAAQLVGNHKIIISPQGSSTSISGNDHQAIVTIDRVAIAFRPTNTNSVTFIQFNEITDQHKELAQLIFA